MGARLHSFSEFAIQKLYFSGALDLILENKLQESRKRGVPERPFLNELGEKVGGQTSIWVPAVNPTVNLSSKKCFTLGHYIQSSIINCKSCGKRGSLIAVFEHFE
jgi:hypothetical protein